MNNLPAEKNRRVLVSDDNRARYDDFRKIPSPATAAALLPARPDRRIEWPVVVEMPRTVAA